MKRNIYLEAIPTEDLQDMLDYCRYTGCFMRFFPILLDEKLRRNEI